MKRGRPTDYNEEMQEKAENYLDNYEDCDEVVPSIAGLSRYLRVARKTLYNWGKNNEAFLHTLEEIEQEQEKQLSNKGLEGTFNSTITKLMLHNHGYSDKQQLSGPDGGPIEVKGVEVSVQK